MEGAKYKVEDKVTLIMKSEFGEQFEEWRGPYATVTNMERGVHKGEKVIWCSIESVSGYTNAYPEQDLLPYFSHDLRVTNKQARILLEESL